MGRRVSKAEMELAFRSSMPVTEIRVYSTDGAYPVCPRCGISMEREYQHFCDRCGQRLNWKLYRHAEIVYPQQREW